MTLPSPGYSALRVGTVAGASLYVSPTAPTGVATGDIWVESGSGLQYLWNGGSWALITNTAVLSTTVSQLAAGLSATQGIVTKLQQDSITQANALPPITAAASVLQSRVTALESRTTVLENATPPPTAPGAPTGLTSTNITNYSVSLAWSAPVGGADTYQTQWASRNTGAWNDGPAPAAATNATIIGLAEGKDYDFHVTASKTGIGPGPASAILQRTTTTSFTPSPAWTQITNNTGTITMNDGGQVSIVNGVVMLKPLNGVLAAMGISANVDLVVKTDTGRIFQRAPQSDQPGGVGWWYWDPTVTPPWVFSNDPRPATPGSPIKVTILDWIRNLATTHLISSQQTHSNFSEFDAMVSTLGVTPGMVIVDPWMDASPNYDGNFNGSCINRCMAHWDAGGLVGVSAFLPNPAGGGSNGVGNPGQVLTVGTSQYNALLASLDQLAVPLLTLKQHGMAVPFRVMWELDGGWFWWGSTSFTQAQQVQLWNLIHDYLTVTKGLDHLIWTFSTNGSGNYTLPTGTNAPDIVGMDAYTDNPGGSGYVASYNRLRNEAPNSPIVWAEFGSGSP